MVSKNKEALIAMLSDEDNYFVGALNSGVKSRVAKEALAALVYLRYEEDCDYRFQKAAEKSGIENVDMLVVLMSKAVKSESARNDAKRLLAAQLEASGIGDALSAAYAQRLDPNGMADAAGAFDIPAGWFADDKAVNRGEKLSPSLKLRNARVLLVEMCLKRGHSNMVNLIASQMLAFSLEADGVESGASVKICVPRIDDVHYFELLNEASTGSALWGIDEEWTCEPKVLGLAPSASAACIAAMVFRLDGKSFDNDSSMEVRDLVSGEGAAGGLRGSFDAVLSNGGSIEFVKQIIELLNDNGVAVLSMKVRELFKNDFELGRYLLDANLLDAMLTLKSTGESRIPALGMGAPDGITVALLRKGRQKGASIYTMELVAESDASAKNGIRSGMFLDDLDAHSGTPANYPWLELPADVPGENWLDTLHSIVLHEPAYGVGADRSAEEIVKAWDAELEAH